MKKLYYVICGKYRKFGNPKISYLLEKTLVLSIICSKTKNEDEKILKEEESIKILRILGLISIEKYQNIIMPEFRKQKIDQIRNYLIEEIIQNGLMCKKHKKVRGVLNYIEHSLIVIYIITGCVSISAFASLVGIPIGITISAIALKICAITVGIKKRKSLIKKKKKKHDKIILLAKSKLK